MLTIYGIRQSRAARCLWALEELGLPYRQVPVDFKLGETKTSDYLALNPMAKVPTLVDGDFVLTESMAINYYLASKQPTPLWPADPRRQARIFQWSSWAATELEFPLTVIVREVRRATAAGGTPDAGVVSTNLEATESTLAALEAELAKGSPYIAGNEFSIGDINVAFAVAAAAPRIAMDRFPATRAWLERCLARPAWQRVQAIDEEALRRGV